MTPRPAAREGPVAPWRPSAAQARFLRALFEPSDAGLLDWARGQAGQPLEPAIDDLLPLAYRRLAGIDREVEVARRARDAYLDTARDNLLRVGRLLDLLRRLNEAGIGAVVLKGAALLARYYRNYGARPMLDVDLLVRPDDVERAVALLIGLGWVAASDVAPAVQHVRRRIHHALTLTRPPSESLDLHWRLLAGMPPEVTGMLWDAAEVVEVESVPMRVLGRTDQLFHVLAHAVQPSWRPSARWTADACAVLDAQELPVQWDRLLDVARRAAMTARVRAALLDVDRLAPGRIPEHALAAASAAAADRAQERELALYERLPPYGTTQILRWHWYLFQRLRASDPGWRRQPALTSFADYVRLRLLLRRRG